MAQKFLNNFDTQFIADVKATATSGTPATELGYGILQVASGAAAFLGTLTGGDYYILTAYKRSGSVESNVEVMKVTSIDTSVINETRLTVQRAQEGTTAQAYVTGDYVSLRFTKGGAEAMLQKSSNLSDLANAATARTNLGVAIGTNVQAWDADLDAIAALAGTSGFLKKTGANTWTLDTASYQPLDADLTAIAALSGSSGFLKTNGSGTWSVDTASYQPLDADLTAIAALTGTSGFLKTNGSGTWSVDTASYQPLDAELTALAGLAVTDGNFIVGNGTTWVVESGATARTSLGLGTSATADTGTSGATIPLLNGANTWSANQTIGANLIFSGSSRRITGDMSDATVANRLMFQTSVTNGNTTVSAIANGTGTAGQFLAYAGSDPANAPFGALLSTTAALQLISSKTGTASTQPLQIVVDGTTRVTVATDGTTTLAGDAIFSKAIQEKVFTITDGAAFEIDPSNGTIQTITLGASRTPKGTNFQAGEAVTLMVLDGTAYTLTWTDATWGGSGVVWVGGTAPTLDTTKYTIIELWKVGTQVYGASPGAA